MIAKCGRVKMWHWAHRSRSGCDPWWENETEWHRGWKNRFLREWQEVVHIDPLDGQKHIADVKTPEGLVIEFQHSPIHPEELKSREEFYKKLVWVVDGDRGSLDPQFLCLGLSWDPICLEPLAYSLKWWGNGRILHNWSEATCEVYIGFGREIFSDEVIWRLYEFDSDSNIGTLIPIRTEWFVEACFEGRQIPTGFVEEKDAWMFRREMVEVEPRRNAS